MTSRVSAASAPTTTACAAHTRLYRDGQLVAEGFPVEEISDHLADAQSVIWLDLLDPDAADLVVITEELGLHPLAVEDAVHDRQRPKVDVYDHVLRVAEWTESLRDLVGSILDTNATLQSNRLNVTVRRLTAYAALLAVTTAITGYYGQNVPYPGYGTRAGFLVSTGVLVTAALVVYVLLRRRKYF